MSRDAEKQLQTQYWLLSLFNVKLAEADKTGEVSERVDKLRAGKATAERRIVELGGTVPE